MRLPAIVGLVSGTETGHDAAVPYRPLFRRHVEPRARIACPTPGRDMQTILETSAGAGRQVPDRPLLSPAALGTGLPRLRRGPVVLGRLQQQAARRCGTGATSGTRSTARRRCSCSTRNSGEANRDRFVQSYRTAAPVARATGYAEMLSHRWLTADHAVQQTRFANGVTVTVNFGDKSYAPPRRTAACSVGISPRRDAKRRVAVHLTWSDRRTGILACPGQTGMSALLSIKSGKMNQ